MRELGRMLKLATPLWPVFAAAAVLAVFTVGANAGMLFAAAYLIAAAALKPPLAELTVTITGIRLFTMLRASCRYAERYLSHDATFRLLSRLRLWVYCRVEGLAAAELVRQGRAELWQRTLNDVEVLQFFFLRVLMPPAVALVLAAAGTAAMLAVAPELAAVLAAGLFLGGVVLPALMAKLTGKEQGRELLAARSRLNAVITDSLFGMREIAAAGKADARRELLAGLQQRLTDCQERAALAAGAAEALAGLVMHLTTLAVLAGAIVAVEEGRLGGVWLAAVALAVQGGFEGIAPLAHGYRYWRESLAAAGRLWEIGENRAAAAVESGPGRRPDSFALVWDKVSVAYANEDSKALDEVSFILPPGARLAVVGPSGAGKSTLAAVLGGLAEYQSGSVKLGGCELRECAPGALRDYVGVVLQHSHIFNASLADNVRLAKPEADEAEVAAALGRAGLGDFLAQCPAGLKTMAGQDGAALSGGQRQRLALARVLLKDPPLVVLDEPTANLDPLAEREVLAAIKAATAGRSVIFITHRLIGLEGMDEILVLDAGKVVERGRFASLLERRGLFYEMWRLQQEVF